MSKPLSIFLAVTVVAYAIGPTSGRFSATALASDAPALLILNEWCAGSSSWNPPVRVVDRLIQKGSTYYMQHGSSNKPEFAGATEWKPGMNGPDELPVEIDGPHLTYTSVDGWRYYNTVGPAGTMSVSTNKNTAHNEWAATCQPVKRAE